MTNERQRSVLRRLEHDTGVVVQGPPGTGKTHTIANLVSALLAQGQRVLVTSARDQALTVLRPRSRGRTPQATSRHRQHPVGRRPQGPRSAGAPSPRSWLPSARPARHVRGTRGASLLGRPCLSGP
ncbi:AAA domain-containing protein [Streptomyces sp. HMX87]|uniref:AAA domain-containing protein n=1 Tax=Streptomyces sp. HMX87 TaxID=3390849 RepID=UPI003A85C92B